MNANMNENGVKINTPTIVPGKVLKSIQAVMKSLEEMEKDMDYLVGDEVKYSYFSLEQLKKQLKPLLTKQSLIIIPTNVDIVENSSLKKVSKETGGEYDVNKVTIKQQYMIVNTEDNSYIVAEVAGCGTDFNDKASSKALSSAFKQLCSQVFCVTTSDDENSEESADEKVETKPKKTAKSKKSKVTPPEPKQDIVKDIPKTINPEDGEKVTLPEGVTPEVDDPVTPVAPATPKEETPIAPEEEPANVEEPANEQNPATEVEKEQPAEEKEATEPTETSTEEPAKEEVEEKPVQPANEEKPKSTVSDETLKKHFQLICPIGVAEIRGKHLGEIVQQALALDEQGRTSLEDNGYKHSIVWIKDKLPQSPANSALKDACADICAYYGW